MLKVHVSALQATVMLKGRYCDGVRRHQEKQEKGPQDLDNRRNFVLSRRIQGNISDKIKASENLTSNLEGVSCRRVSASTRMMHR